MHRCRLSSAKNVVRTACLKSLLCFIPLIRPMIWATAGFSGLWGCSRDRLQVDLDMDGFLMVPEFNQAAKFRTQISPTENSRFSGCPLVCTKYYGFAYEQSLKKNILCRRDPPDVTGLCFKMIVQSRHRLSSFGASRSFEDT